MQTHPAQCVALMSTLCHGCRDLEALHCTRHAAESVACQILAHPHEAGLMTLVCQRSTAAGAGLSPG